MLTSSENSLTILIVLIAVGILGWGYYRAKSFGKLGILAWLQSVSLMTPWLLFFGLFTLGIYINLVGVLFLLIASTGAYIYLGKLLRDAGQDEILRSQAQEMLNHKKSEVTDINSDAVKPPEVTVFPLAGMDKVVPIPADHLKLMQGIFGIDTFFATETIPYQDGVIFNGNLRGEPAIAHTRLSENLQEKLGELYRLFLVENPQDRPVVIILPSKNDPTPMNLSQKILAVVLLIATIITCWETGGILLGFDLFVNPLRYQEPLPIALGILTVLILHEIGHQIAAKRHQVRFSFPFFIPTWQIGSFGAFNRFESLVPNRNALLDVALAGPATGGIVSFLMLLSGFLLSHEGSLFKVPTDFFKGSLLVGTLAKVVLGSALQKEVVEIHPLAIIGWLGLIITAINLMPAGQLDGGRIMQAIYGRKTARWSTLATFIVLAIASLVNPIALYWAVVILIIQRQQERPCLNDLSEPDDARAAWGLLALFLMIATLIPLTPVLAGRLGIGS